MRKRLGRREGCRGRMVGEESRREIEIVVVGEGIGEIKG